MNDPTKPTARTPTAAAPLPLFGRFPPLAARLPHVPLGLFPTPVEKVASLGNALGLERLYMKRDDLSGAVYGGNKVRMLEFLLGGALRANAREVVTVGYAGSNQALALAIYARKGILKNETVLFWNTYNSRDLTSVASGLDYHLLPRGFHRYFEDAVQPLDEGGFDR